MCISHMYECICAVRSCIAMYMYVSISCTCILTIQDAYIRIIYTHDICMLCVLSVVVLNYCYRIMIIPDHSLLYNNYIKFIVRMYVHELKLHVRTYIYLK